MIDELYVFYRSIGCNDESATDEEQGEKMLYSYPPGKSLNDQLGRVMMLEGLIDFTCKFRYVRYSVLCIPLYIPLTYTYTPYLYQ